MILVCGGAGYIGAHVNKWLNRAGYGTVVLDNLVYGHREAVKWGTFVEGDLADEAFLERVFSEYPIDAVMHFSAYAYVGESVEEPGKYYRNNVVNTVHLLDAMLRHKVSRIVFSSTCATYGVPAHVPITEDMPQNPVNPYGRTKLMVEEMLEDYRRAYGLQYCALRYFNAAGADRDAEIGELHVPETHLIPLALDAAIGRRKSVSVFGTDYPTKDGTCVRDYIHVEDLADAHARALAYISENRCSEKINLGNGIGYSVMEVIEMARKVTGKEIPVTCMPRRPGDPPELVGSARKAREILGWQPRHDLESIVRTAWEWHRRVNGGCNCTNTTIS